jgi:hypothetical protein
MVVGLCAIQKLFKSSIFWRAQSEGRCPVGCRRLERVRNTTALFANGCGSIPRDTRDTQEAELSHRASAHPNCWHERPATERYFALVSAGKVRFGMIDRR